jgi:enoyl-[acyl-carrier protein] reductase I
VGLCGKLQAQGARLAFSYQSHFEDRAKELIQGLPQSYGFIMDVQEEAQLQHGFKQLHEEFGPLDFILHAIAHAKKEELQGHFVETSREGYLMAQDVSSYSLTAVARHALPLLTKGASITTLTYLGGERVVPNYNVMGVAKAALEMSVRYLAADLGEQGIRVNAVSAGPVRTLASSGVTGFKKMMDTYAEKTPLRRNIEAEEVANAVLFLASPLASGITGEILHVDCGYHIMGL